MFARKMIALTALVLLVAMVSEPALAGVGGCRWGSCGSGGDQINFNNQPTSTPSVLDSLVGAVPTSVITTLKLMFTSEPVLTGPQEDPIYSDGVGGCWKRPGVGGCIL